MILDCTLRDGGYYVNWDFEPNTVRKYLTAVTIAKIDVIEIGFRFLPVKKFLGAFAYSTDEYLNLINLPSSIPIAVMVNSADLLDFQDGVDAAVNQLFTEKRRSPVDIVRVAINIQKVGQCREIIFMLDSLGYRVFLNLMQVDTVDFNELERISNLISSWGVVEVLYLADSFGSMDPGSIKNTVQVVTKGWSGYLGIHAHDNKGLAILNTLAAYETGVKYLDSTIYGMGRGAGNARTEYLLTEFVQRNTGEYFPDAIFPLIMHDFHFLQQKHQWGPNIYYYLSATYGIHPTYIQEMISDERYGDDQILSAINFLKSSKGPSFSFKNMLRAGSGVEGSSRGTWSAKGTFSGRTVLILGSGSSTKKYIDTLQLFVEKNKPFVLCLNINQSVPEGMVDAYVSCHEMRILIESDYYRKISKPIILPLARVPKVTRKIIKCVEILDYGLQIKDGHFEVLSKGCVLFSPLALGYAISVATIGGANEILLAGVDGYDSTDKRQIEMVELFQRYAKLESHVRISAITPTTVPVEQDSVFRRI